MRLVDPCCPLPVIDFDGSATPRGTAKHVRRYMPTPEWIAEQAAKQEAYKNHRPYLPPVKWRGSPK